MAAARRQSCGWVGYYSRAWERRCPGGGAERQAGAVNRSPLKQSKQATTQQPTAASAACRLTLRGSLRWCCGWQSAACCPSAAHQSPTPGCRGKDEG